MRIALYSRQLNEENSKYVHSLIDSLKKRKFDLVLFEPMILQLKKQGVDIRSFDVFRDHSDIKENVDFVFSVGGDGTLLDTLTLVQNSGIPILGINTGRMGFLSSVSKDYIYNAVDSIEKGHYSLDKRTLLKLESNKTLFGDINYALNELTIHKKDSSSMIIIHTYLNGEYLNSYWADGLLVATPSGSTGYSLSCGGPIIVPQAENFIVTPIAPHNLNVRPIVVPDKNVISLEVEGRSTYFMASLDSRSVTIDSSIQLAVRKADFTMNLVRLENENFLKTLREKLLWGLDARK
ncbi:MAG TPA: NAD kinase [Bacteroidia bacterium]|nr:NAD kinase [Bacteroidia bacterium]HNT79714.1 NAD kinase [Bacteroidia bacterium]